MFSAASEKNIIKKNSDIAALIFAGIKFSGELKTFFEVAKNSECDIKEVALSYRSLVREMEILPTLGSPKIYIPRFCKEFGLPKTVEKEANNILDKYKKSPSFINYYGSHAAWAAAAIDIASTQYGEKTVSKEISEKVGISEIMVRTKYQELCNALGIEKF